MYYQILFEANVLFMGGGVYIEGILDSPAYFGSAPQKETFKGDLGRVHKICRTRLLSL